ncbi:hypothetical protein JCM1840_000059 [Sporobolomyces johnsonii]
MNQAAPPSAAAGPSAPSLAQAIASVDHPAVLAHLARLEIRRHLALATANDLLDYHSVLLTERERSALARIVSGDAQDHGTMRFCAIDLGWRRALADSQLLSTPSSSSTSLSPISLTLEHYFSPPIHPHSLIGDPLAPGLDMLLRFGRVYYQIVQERENEGGTPLGERERKTSKIDARVLGKMTGDWARCAERIARRVEGIRANYPEINSQPAHASHIQNSNSQDSLPTPSPSSEDQPLVHRTSQRRPAAEAPQKRSREEEEVEVETGERRKGKVTAAAKKARTFQEAGAESRPEPPQEQEPGQPTEDAPMEVDGVERAKPASPPRPAPNASSPLTQAVTALAPPQSDAAVAPGSSTRMRTISTTNATLAVPAPGSTSTSTSISARTRARSRSPLSPAPPSAAPPPTSAFPALALSQLPALLPPRPMSRPLTTTPTTADSQPAPFVAANSSRNTAFILGRLQQGSNANQKKLSDRRKSAAAGNEAGGGEGGAGWPGTPVPAPADSKEEKSAANENKDEASSSGSSSKATGALAATASGILMPPPPAKPRPSQSKSQPQAQSQPREDPATVPTPPSPPQPAVPSTSQSSQSTSSSAQLEPSTQLSSQELPPPVAQPHAQDTRDAREPAPAPASALGSHSDEKEKPTPLSSQSSEHSEPGKPKILVPDTSASTFASSGSSSNDNPSTLISDSQSSSNSNSASTSRSTKEVPSSSEAASLDFRLSFSSSQPLRTTSQMALPPQRTATQPPAKLEVVASSVTGDSSGADSSQSQSQSQQPQTQALFVSTTTAVEQEDELQSQSQSQETTDSGLSYLSHAEVARREEAAAATAAATAAAAAAAQTQPQLDAAADPDERAGQQAGEGVLEEDLGEAEPLSQAPEPEPEDGDGDELKDLYELASDDDEESQRRRIGRSQSFENLHAAASSSQEDSDDNNDVFDERFLLGDVEYEGMTLSRND